jgi:hypothetical protein
MIPQCQQKGLIPNDQLSKSIFPAIEAFLARERQETGNAHPSKEYSNEKNAKLVLNTAMIFIQHALS